METHESHTVVAHIEVQFVDYEEESDGVLHWTGELDVNWFDSLAWAIMRLLPQAMNLRDTKAHDAVRQYQPEGGQDE